MNAIIFYSIAEYSNSAIKMTIKQVRRKVKTEICIIGKGGFEEKTKTYLTKNLAYKAYKELMGTAIIGQWKVLNSSPEHETWETRE